MLAAASACKEARDFARSFRCFVVRRPSNSSHSALGSPRSDMNTMGGPQKTPPFALPAVRTLREVAGALPQLLSQVRNADHLYAGRASEAYARGRAFCEPDPGCLCRLFSPATPSIQAHETGRHFPRSALERSRLRGGRFACNTLGIMHHHRTLISSEI